MSEETDAHALPPGTRLSEYEIVRVLGSGGFGITYLARDLHLDREVVIKENLPVFACRDPRDSTVRPRGGSEADRELFAWSLESFLREARTLARFDHPYIVKVWRVLEAHGTAYFVMPFVEGETFAEQIARRQREGRPFAREEMLALLMPLLDALETLHAAGVYHRDVKPGNILITGSAGKETPVLIDFGAARQQVGEKSMTVIESPGYTPFEQLQSRGEIGPWSDLYALAATFYRAITFESPPHAADRVGREDPIRPLATAGPHGASLAGLGEALDLALRFAWQDRPSSAAELRANLQSSDRAQRLGPATTTTTTETAPPPPEASPASSSASRHLWPGRCVQAYYWAAVALFLGSLVWWNFIAN